MKKQFLSLAMAAMLTASAGAYLPAQNVSAVEVIDNIFHFDVENGEAAFIGCDERDGLPLRDMFTPQDSDGIPVTRIGWRTFYDHQTLTSIVITDNILETGMEVFAECKRLYEITFGMNMTEIAGESCKNCTGLLRAFLPDGLRVIGNGAFDGCSALASIELPQQLETIEAFAFCRTGLTEITIPTSVKEIGYQSFFCCPDLEKITILNPDCEIDDTSGMGVTICNSVRPNDEFDPPSEGFYEFGVYNGTICGYEGSTAHEFAEKHGYKFEALKKPETTDNLKGDLNGDGLVNLKDVVLLRRYIAGGWGVTL